MLRMALFAKESLRQLQEIVVGRTMRRVTGGTGFRVVCMFIKKWPGLLGMATTAGLSLGHGGQLEFILGAMGVVAVSAVDLALLDRVPAR
jgi:hypothetical protein